MKCVSRVKRRGAKSELKISNLKVGRLSRACEGNVQSKKGLSAFYRKAMLLTAMISTHFWHMRLSANRGTD